jgi:hypothetical protein
VVQQLHTVAIVVTAFVAFNEWLLLNGKQT